MNEQSIQDRLYKYIKSTCSDPYAIILPNTMLCRWKWESDLLYITKAGYVTEYEIKLSNGDFAADMNKSRKHEILMNGGGPTYFYYVCPTGIIHPEDVPSYAGLIYVDSDMGVNEALKCERTKRAKPLSNEEWIEIATKSLKRYWRLRIKNKLRGL